MSTVEVLKKARALIEDPERWTQGAMKRRDGRMCAVGAVLVARGRKRPLLLDAQTDPAVAALAGHDDDEAHYWAYSEVTDLNDSYSHPAVLDLFDVTIARLEKS